MDRSFMREFFRNYYSDPFRAATENSVLFFEKHKICSQAEEELIGYLGGTNTKAYHKFDEYMTALTAEYDVMLEEMYLLGAMDRDKMLR